MKQIKKKMSRLKIKLTDTCNDDCKFYVRIVKECNWTYTTQLIYTSDNKVTAEFCKELYINSRFVTIL